MKRQRGCTRGHSDCPRNIISSTSITFHRLPGSMCNSTEEFGAHNRIPYSLSKTRSIAMLIACLLGTKMQEGHTSSSHRQLNDNSSLFHQTKARKYGSFHSHPRPPLPICEAFILLCLHFTNPSAEFPANAKFIFHKEVPTPHEHKVTFLPKHCRQIHTSQMIISHMLSATP